MLNMGADEQMSERKFPFDDRKKPAILIIRKSRLIFEVLNFTLSVYIEQGYLI